MLLRSLVRSFVRYFVISLFLQWPHVGSLVIYGCTSLVVSLLFFVYVVSYFRISFLVI